MSVLVKEPVRTPVAVMKAVEGFSEATVRALSASRNEPEWMLAFRLEAWRQFEAMPWPKATDEAWRRTRLTGFNLKKFKPYAVSSGKQARATLPQLDPDRAERDGELGQPGLRRRQHSLQPVQHRSGRVRHHLHRHAERRRRIPGPGAEILHDPGRQAGAQQVHRPPCRAVGFRRVHLRAGQCAGHAAAPGDPEPVQRRRGRLPPHAAGHRNRRRDHGRGRPGRRRRMVCRPASWS